MQTKLNMSVVWKKYWNNIYFHVMLLNIHFKNHLHTFGTLPVVSLKRYRSSPDRDVSLQYVRQTELAPLFLDYSYFKGYF